jgi:hypothetical protein
MSAELAATLARVRRWIMALLVAGVVATGIELLLLDHDEDALQLVPLLLIACACAVLAWHGVSRTARSVRLLQAVMALFVVSAFAGLALHFRGNLEFQLELDASQSRWQLFTKVMRAKAPPALAPAVMAELGILGLLYAYRHPSTTRSPDGFGSTEEEGSHQR